MNVNKKEIGDIFEVSSTTIDVYMKNGMPYDPAESKGYPNKYNTRECIDWWKHSKDEKLDWNKERARLTKFQADKAEIELQVLEGELLNADDVVKEWSNIFNQIKNSLLNVPTKASTLLQGVESMQETKTILEKLLREVLDKIAK